MIEISFFQVWPFLFSHYSFDSTIDERNNIDRTTIERYNSLNNEWHNAEQVVLQVDLRHSNRRKNTLTKLFNSSFEAPNPNANESTLTSIKNALASIPEKIAIAGFHHLERKDSNVSNDVFYEVKFSVQLIQIDFFLVFSGLYRTYCINSHSGRIRF